MLAGLTLPAGVKQQLVKSANQSLAMNSNTAYNSGLASYLKSCEKHGFAPSFPLPVEHQLCWLLTPEDDLKAATAELRFFRQLLG